MSRVSNRGWTSCYEIPQQSCRIDSGWYIQVLASTVAYEVYLHGDSGITMQMAFCTIW